MSVFAKNPRDRRQLKRLVVYHYLLAALQALVAAILVIILVTSTPETRAASTTWAVDGFWGGRGFLGMDGFWMVACAVAAQAGLTVLAGHRIAERRSYSYCLTVAALNCFSFPFGTMVGVWTLMVLKRPSVREVFADTRSQIANVNVWEDRPIP